MTEQRAKEVLRLYRPGSPQSDDPEIAEALALVRQSPELQKWFDAHCAVQASISAGFKKIPVPEGLKQQILSERKAHLQGFWPRNPATIVAATAIIALIIVVVVIQWPLFYGYRPPRENFAIYRERMRSVALEPYGMVETNDLSAIRAYFTQHEVDTNWTLPKGLEHAALTGCAIAAWQGKPVAMVCFRSGQPLPPGQTTDVWLFIADSDSIKNAPAPGTPQMKQLDDVASAGWSTDGKTYLLEARGDMNFLQRFM